MLDQSSDALDEFDDGLELTQVLYIMPRLDL